MKPPLQERYVEKIIIHEHYHPGLEHNDIALLKITPPVVCGRFVGPGCLPQFAEGPPSIPQKCWVIGWGFLRENGEHGGAPGAGPARGRAERQTRSGGDAGSPVEGLAC